MGIISPLIRGIKSPISIILITLFLILFIISSRPFSTSVSHHSGVELEEVLRAAAMPSRTVILTMVDERWGSNGSIIDVFVESFRIGEHTKHLLNHLIIVCLDMQSFNYCKSLHSHCFHLQLTRAKDSFASFNAHKRNQLLLQLLRFGYNLLYTDADVMWVKNPFALMSGEPSKISIGCDSYEDRNGEISSGGFFYMNANDISIGFINLWNLIMVLYPQTQNQSLCEMATYEDLNMSSNIHFVDTRYYGGFCHPNKDITNIYMMHANCCPDLDNKLHDLTIFLHHSNHKPLMAKPTTLQMLSSSSKSPMMCF